MKPVLQHRFMSDVVGKTRFFVACFIEALVHSARRKISSGATTQSDSMPLPIIQWLTDQVKINI